MAIRWTDTTPSTTLPALAGRPRGRVDVSVEAAAEATVLAHLRAAHVEQGGLLIGRAFVDPDSGAVNHIRIVASAAADESDGTAISLRMGTAVWTAAQALLTPGLLIVGWYHSHPGLTAFFSDTDRRTQRAFFHHDYSVGWVIDTLLGEEAWYVGPDSRPLKRAAPDELGGPEGLAGPESREAE